MLENNVIKIGEYIVIQRQNYKKLHKFNKTNSCISLGRDTVELTGIEGCPYHSIFRMVNNSSNNKKNRNYQLVLSDEVLDFKDEIDLKISGTDNRNIFDDGRSQKLTASEIEELRSDSNKASDIVESLISNSNTFHNKTEFSQEKYLRKKQKKYFEYVQILKPNLRIIADVMYKLDPLKIQGIRLDTMSQIISMANIYSEGIHLLYDSGSNGLMAAALLNSIGEHSDGKLLHMHPGNMSQKQALLAMNFSETQSKKCVTVNIYSGLRQYYQGTDIHCKNSNTQEGILMETTNDSNGKEEVKCEDGGESYDNNDMGIVDEEVYLENKLKRKVEIDSDKPKTKIRKYEDSVEKEGIEENVCNEPKMPRWHYENRAAAELLKEKVDSLVIACKEDPLNLFNELVQFVKPGRPFVIYHSVCEPLQHLYLALKPRTNVAALKLTCNWMRNYQILPERTHPEVMMNGSSGFLLTGYVLK